jgi:hypothetical protein
MDSSGSGWGPVASFFGYGNDLFGFIKGGEFLEQLPDYQYLLHS